MPHPRSRSPLHTRRGVPFYCDKSPGEFRADRYEQYDEFVVRQTWLHLMTWSEIGYPFQPVLDWVFTHLPPSPPATLADIGCGVGRLAAELAEQYPLAWSFGVDYSYQMLRRAREFWLEGQPLPPGGEARGLALTPIRRPSLPRLDLLLARAGDLPFRDASLDLLLSTFLLDRVTHPTAMLRELRRVVKPDGRLLLVSPLNFEKAANWRDFYPPERLEQQLENLGWKVNAHDLFDCREPLDGAGNALVWRCQG